jgi:4-hydroxybenzoyl-CoA reductase subunit beta
LTLPRFDYISPASLAEALASFDEESVFVAGGTDLFVRMKERSSAPTRVIGLLGIPELKGLRWLDNGEFSIGAANTLTCVAEDPTIQASFPALARAVEMTSSPLLRNAGTIGGNLCLETRCTYYNQPAIFKQRWEPCLKLGGEGCHVVRGGRACHAVYSGDLAGPLIALGAAVTVTAPGRTRELTVAELLADSGLSPTTLGKGEMVTAVHLPRAPAHWGLSYQKLRLRDTVDFPLLGVSVFLNLEGPQPGARCQGARVVLSAAGPSPLLIEEAGQRMEGRAVTGEIAEEVALLVQKRAHPVANTASTPGYRREMTSVLTKHAIADAVEQIVTSGV